MDDVEEMTWSRVDKSYKINKPLTISCGNLDNIPGIIVGGSWTGITGENPDLFQSEDVSGMNDRRLPSDPSTVRLRRTANKFNFPGAALFALRAYI